MADWNKPLPGKAVEGSATHVDDHNLLVDALAEVRANVDEVEKQPGPPGDPGKKGDKGNPGKDGAPSQEEWDALVARVDALEAE